jgi:hypothetical protein
VPSKTPKQKTKAKRIAGRGRVDLLAGKVNPRSIRFGLGGGRYGMQPGNPPDAPPEWQEWKRKRFAWSIIAAWQFMKGKEIDQVKLIVRKPEVTRQRIAQMVNEGVKFLLDRRFIFEVK